MTEDRTLASYACHAPQSRGRLVDEGGAPLLDDLKRWGMRTAYQRDRDRVLHSGAFRRLKHKTQVFVYHEGDYFRTRLTHSLEVAQIARSISRSLRLNDDLAEAVALAHDLGHTPFGHAGEEVLDRLMEPFGGFDHNEQTVRVLTSLERRYAGFDGLNLTWETLEGVVKHNGPFASEGDIPANFKQLDADMSLDVTSYPSAEAQLANLSDDIAYLSHDFDDALRADLFRLDAIQDLPQVGKALRDINAKHGQLDITRTTHELVRRLISVFVEDLLETSAANLAHLGAKHSDDIRNAKGAVIAFSEPMARDLEILRSFLFKNMWRHYKVNRMTSKAKRVVTDLFNLFMSEPNTLPNEWQETKLGSLADQKDDVVARVIADYIASMTDRYAILEHERLFDLGPILR
ncbi:deoxyguanosinetriphosphate triphosphohydrolase [Candidatus Puniceispirillum sp.]|uniref:deoxyguanosinetriphosphate triphosphohydrolase n=1 Tax=Candidatus Puniceispirillum sp. TaxID=2026719 RepID=UPI001EC2C0CB|nr:deoxyguanosinetriphosphate triphosphohydrolase [Candidatus Puniceispirillum sp.]